MAAATLHFVASAFCSTMGKIVTQFWFRYCWLLGKMLLLAKKGEAIMAENLFILGAGTSFDAGAPLMSGFLDKAYELHIGGEVNSYKKQFEDVFKLLAELRLVYANSHLDLNNIESLFGAIEMGRIINTLGIRSDESIEEARRALVKLIVTTLEGSIVYLRDEGRHVMPPRTYMQFVKLIQEKLPNTSIITFNYDVALDYALSFNGINFDYCTLPESSPNGMKLMKLHGSVNWALCKECEAIIPIHAASGFQQTISVNRSSGIRTNFSEKIGQHEHESCNGNGGLRSRCYEVPVIVPPTWNKKDYHGNLTNVWRQAAIELNEARNIYIIGYSLPESDSFFRYLFALGTLNNAIIKRIWVFNPDESEATKSRYAALIGKGLENRYKYEPKKFDNAIAELLNLEE